MSVTSSTTPAPTTAGTHPILHHGILVHDENLKRMSSSSKNIHWDEEIIAQHDLERGTRGKIDEPNTPFNRQYSAEGDEDEVPEFSPQDLADRLAELEERQENGETLDDEAEKKRKFEEKRRNHYQEFLVMKERRDSMQDEDE